MDILTVIYKNFTTKVIHTIHSLQAQGPSHERSITMQRSLVLHVWKACLVKQSPARLDHG